MFFVPNIERPDLVLLLHCGRMTKRWKILDCESGCICEHC